MSCSTEESNSVFFETLKYIVYVSIFTIIAVVVIYMFSGWCCPSKTNTETQTESETFKPTQVDQQTQPDQPDQAQTDQVEQLTPEQVEQNLEENKKNLEALRGDMGLLIEQQTQPEPTPVELIKPDTQVVHVRKTRGKYNKRVKKQPDQPTLEPIAEGNEQPELNEHEDATSFVTTNMTNTNDDQSDDELEDDQPQDNM